MDEDHGALAEALMDALCESPIWEGRHIGDLEYHICDTIAEKLQGYVHDRVVAALAPCGTLADDLWREGDPRIVAPYAVSVALRDAARRLRIVLPSGITMNGSEMKKAHHYTEALVRVLRDHPQRPSATRGVERCGCGSSEWGSPGWWAGHVAESLAGIVFIAEAGALRRAEVGLLALAAGESYDPWAAAILSNDAVKVVRAALTVREVKG